MNWTDDPTLSAAVDRLRELMAQHGCYASTLSVNGRDAMLSMQGEADKMDYRAGAMEWSSDDHDWRRCSDESGIEFVSHARKVTA